MTAELRFLLGQVLGILATVITVISYQMNTKRSLLLVQTTATACTCLAYLFLDAASGFALNIVCIMRNVVFYCQKERKKVNVPAVLLALAMVGVGFLSWQGPVSLLIIAALVANTLFMSVGDPQLLRKSVLVTSTMILLYNILVFSLGGIANEGLSVISSAVGIVRFRREKTEK